uniref:Putative primase n=1 Tax=viral metagenome TaxID=1070528 RepID=A0A6M3XFD2_9ZZZZ
MARYLPNWIDGYMELMLNTEPARLFDLWTAYSVIAAALRRKVYLQLGRLTYFPNIYCVFVAEPGVARKTQAVKYGVELLSTIPEIKMSSDSATKEAMTDDIFDSGLDALMPDNSNMRHSSLNIISKEFESFLGQKKENTRMLMALTDLYDCPDEWSSRTRHSGSTKIIRPWLNLIAATTPDSLASSLPASAVGGGLTSRILFIWADKKKRPVAIPSMTPKELILKDHLIKDLYVISRISGEYVMTADCINHWQIWYDQFDEDESGNRICADKSFNGWYSRKPTFIIKIAMLRSAAEADTRVVQWRHIEEALQAVRDVELVMGNAFKAIGKSEITAEVDTVLQLVRSSRDISEKQLMTTVWRDIDSSKFDNVIETLIKTGKVRREYQGPNKEKGIWYKSTE